MPKIYRGIHWDICTCVCWGAKERGTTAGIAVGAVIALEALFAVPICGASMNPARAGAFEKTVVLLLFMA